MKKTLLVFFLLLGALWAMPLQAHDFTAKLKGGQTLYFNITDTVKHTVELTYQGKIRDQHENLPEGRLEIPRTVKFKDVIYTVTAIGPKAFSGAAQLEALVIPATVEKICDFAFEDCSKLRAILFPGSPVEFGEGVFYRCPAIENLSFGSDWKEINLGVFRWSDCLKHVSIPARVEKITNLKTIASLERVCVDPNNSHFSSATGLLLSKNGKTLFACPRAYRGAVVVPEGVEAVLDGAFIDCPFIEEVTFPDTLKDLPYQEFSRNNQLKSLVFLSAEPILNYTGEANEEPRFALQVASPDVKVFVPAASFAAWRNAVREKEGFVSKKSIKKNK